MIPHPSITEILVSLEVFLALYVPKKILDIFIDTEVKLVKKRIYKFHREQHGGWFRWCRQGQCRRLTPSRSSTQSQEELAQLVSAEEPLV